MKAWISGILMSIALFCSSAWAAPVARAYHCALQEPGRSRNTEFTLSFLHSESIRLHRAQETYLSATVETFVEQESVRVQIVIYEHLEPLNKTLYRQRSPWNSPHAQFEAPNLGIHVACDAVF